MKTHIKTTPNTSQELRSLYLGLNDIRANTKARTQQAHQPNIQLPVTNHPIQWNK